MVNPDSKPPDMTPLAEASTDAILDELDRRFDHGVFAGMRIVSEQKKTINWRKIGNGHTAAGLGLHVALKALRQVEELANGENGE